MPTYAYECSNCGEQFERVQKFTDEPVTKCPKCKKNKVRRVVQASAIVFKGSGWYITDHRSNSKKTASSSSSHSDSSNGDKSAEKSDKAAEKAEKADKSDKASDKPEKAAKTETKAAKSESSAGSSKASSSD